MSTSQPLVVVTDSVFTSLAPVERVLAQIGAKLVVARDSTAEAILAAGREADAVMVTYAQVRGDVIGGLRRCRIIARFGIGVDNLDVTAASHKGIVVTNVPDYCIDEVSDHALALLLSVVRKVTYTNQRIGEGEQQVQSAVPIHRLRDRTLGLVGFGRIARALVPKTQALGLKVVAYDPYISTEMMRQFDVARMTLEELLRAADYVSLHVPLTDATRNLLNSRAFAQMKNGAFLVNTARGPLVDESALAEALDSAKLAGAALDVFPQEPLKASSPLLELMSRKNLILTPHIAFYSEESQVELQEKAAGEVVRVLSGREPSYPVKPGS